MILNARRKRRKCWPLPPMLRVRRADLGLIYIGLGKSVLTGISCHPNMLFYLQGQYSSNTNIYLWGLMAI